MRLVKLDWLAVTVCVVFLVIALLGYIQIFGGYQEVAFSTVNRSLSSVGSASSSGPTSMPPGIPPAMTKLGDFGIFSQEPCGPPCFQSIRPGVTTMDDAALILKNAGLACYVREIQPQGKALDCPSSGASITVTTSGLCTADSGGLMVGGISLLPLTRITLAEFIARYGQLDSLQMAAQAIFFYNSLQTALIVSKQPGQQSYTLMPDTTIDEVVYVTAADFSKCLHTWKGYGTYSPNTGP